MYFWYATSTDKRRGGQKMVDTNKLRGIIAEQGFSQRKVAAGLGMTEKTFTPR